MSAASPDRLRHEYESSLSWRLTRPVRAAGRLAGALRPSAAAEAPEPPPERLDSWLTHFHDERLRALDADCATRPGPEGYARFRDLDDELWALLLTQEYAAYPHIRALLPAMPEPRLQELWNGRSGLALASQTSSFYRRLRGTYARHGSRALADSRVLDFGCGWGRLTRCLIRDVVPGHLYACDPVEGILDACRADGVPAVLARSDFRPDRLPFAERFDLAFAFSVFTHLSERAHERCLAALHASLERDGILVVTIRPPGYLPECEALHPLLAELGPDPEAALAQPRYLFAAHPADPSHFQRDARGEIDYGETVVTMAYVRERWAPRFELLDVGLLLDDPHQVVLTLRRA